MLFRNVAIGAWERGAIGEAGLRVVQKVGTAWQRSRGGGTRARLQRRLGPVACPLRAEILAADRAGADSKLAWVCENLIALEPALRRLVVMAGSRRRTPRSGCCAGGCSGGRTPSVAAAWVTDSWSGC